MDKKELWTVLRRSAVSVPGGRGELTYLPQAVGEELRSKMGFTRWEFERAALEAGIVPGRYLRNMGTLGIAGQLRLAAATAAVVGCGGLGGLVVELLARTGIGKLLLVDDDVFADNNLNRQILCREADLGRPKVEVARERVAAINPAVEVQSYKERLGPENARTLLQAADIAVDALDNLPARFALEQAARELGIPLVHGAIAGFFGQVLTIFPADPGFTEIYGAAGSRERGVEVETGNLPATAALVASLQVQEVVKVLTGLGEPLRRRLLYVDSASGQTYTMRLGGEEEIAGRGVELKKQTPILSFIGTSGGGKTTLMLEVIKDLVQRGVKVAAVKHTHEDAPLDTPGKDTWRFRRAGASGVALLSAGGAQVFYDLDAPAATDRLRGWFADADVILVEGLKRGPFPKIAVFRSGISQPLVPVPADIVAVVGDVAAARAAGLPAEVPGFGWQEIGALGDFILRC